MTTSSSPRWALLAAAVVSTPLATSGQSDAPKITLNLKDVTLEQAADALGLAAKTPLELPPVVRETTPVGSEKATTSFQWNAVPFRIALRELCNRYGLVPVSGRGGFLLTFDHPDRHKGFPDRIQEQEHRGMRMFLANRTWGRGTRTIRDGEESGGEPVLHLTFVVLLGDRDRDTVNGFRNVVAKDDRGRVLKQLGPSGFPQRFFPDEWAHTITLQGASEGATRLVSISGDLMVHGTARRRTLEAKVPLRGKTSRPSVEGVVLEVFPSLPIPVGQESGPGHRIQASLQFPKEAQLEVDGDSVGFQVLDTQGKPLPFGRHGGGSQKAKDFELTQDFGPTQARPDRVVARWREQSAQGPLFTFKMTDIPLPQRP